MTTEPIILNNRYELQEPLGRGAFAQVWRARDRLLGRPVAVKMLERRLVELEGDAFGVMFQQEARAVAALDHPHIVHVYDVGEEGRQLYLVMELLPGGDLYQSLQTHGPYSLAETLALLTPIADALDVAHAAGLIHRDVKPQNILFARQQRPVLTDFGLVKVLSGSLYVSNPAFSGGQLLGTPEYMAPEQAQSRPVDARTDVYALAAVAFQLLTGKVPFQGDTAMSTLFLAVSTPRADLRSRLPASLPPAAADCLLAALAVNPGERPAAPGEWLRQLQAAHESQAAAQAEQRAAARQAALLQQAQREKITQLEQQAASARQQQQWLAELGRRAPALHRAPGGLPIVSSMDELRGLRELPPRILWEKDGREMALVPAGPFTMGMSEAEARQIAQQSSTDVNWWLTATPAHQVELPAYYLDVTPVTHAAYARFLAANPQHPVPFKDTDWTRPYNWNRAKRTPPAGLENHPVVLVSWSDAVAYAAWAGKRLPTEAEWEKGARGTDQRIYPWGNTWDSSCLNSHEGPVVRPVRNLTECVKEQNSMEGWFAAARTTPVGAYPLGASPFGLLDMAGNVLEWCANWLEPYPGNVHPWGRYGQTCRALRGGSWNIISRTFRATYRGNNGPSNRSVAVGFRCAQE